MVDIDTQGTGDPFYKAGQLLPENFLNAARKAGYNETQVRIREQVGYDHSYYFVSPCSVFFRSTS
jgi:S-formylglutathione hydrolase